MTSTNKREDCPEVRKGGVLIQAYGRRKGKTLLTTNITGEYSPDCDPWGGWGHGKEEGKGAPVLKAVTLLHLGGKRGDKERVTALVAHEPSHDGVLPKPHEKGKYDHHSTHVQYRTKKE